MPNTDKYYYYYYFLYLEHLYRDVFWWFCHLTDGSLIIPEDFLSFCCLSQRCSLVQFLLNLLKKIANRSFISCSSAGDAEPAQGESKLSPL